MGVDYDANYGIGFKIKLLNSVEHNEDKNYTIEHLESELDGERFEYFQVGEDCYGGDTNELFVCAVNPFEHGIPDLEHIKSEIKTHLDFIGIETDGDLDLLVVLEFGNRRG